MFISKRICSMVTILVVTLHLLVLQLNCVCFVVEASDIVNVVSRPEVENYKQTVLTYQNIEEIEETLDELHRHLAKIALKNRALKKNKGKFFATRNGAGNGGAFDTVLSNIGSHLKNNGSTGLGGALRNESGEKKATIQMFLGYMEATKSAIGVLAKSNEFDDLPAAVASSADSALSELDEITSTLREALGDESLVTGSGPVQTLIGTGFSAAIATVQLYVSIMNNLGCCKLSISLLNNVTGFLENLRSIANPGGPTKAPVTAPKPVPVTVPVPAPVPVAAPAAPTKATPTAPTPTKRR